MNKKERLSKDFEKQFRKDIRLIKSFLFELAVNRHNIAVGFSDYFNAYICAVEEDNKLKALFAISFILKDMDTLKEINPWEYQFLPSDQKSKYQLSIKVKTRNIFHDRVFNDFNSAIDFAKKNL